MTTYVIPTTGWTTVLSKALSECNDGDTILVHSKSMKELAERAQARVCPDKMIIFKIVTQGPQEWKGE